MTTTDPATRCTVADANTDGRYCCTRRPGHDGPCAAVPVSSSAPSGEAMPADVPEYVLRPIRRMWHDAQDEIARLTREQATRTAALDALREAVKGCGKSWSGDSMEPDVCGTREFGVTLLCPSCLPTLWRAVDALTGERGDFGEHDG